VLNLGLPDRFVEHAQHNEMLAECRLDKKGILAAIRERLKQYPQEQQARPKVVKPVR